ncbi:MAG: MFS transporter [Anaerolineaceae bacterium]|nr:MFS transporter [Anaerolineaceae bacterium]
MKATVAQPAEQPATESTFRPGAVLTVSFAHFAHDLNGAYLAPLIPLLRAKMGISHTAIGLLVVLMQLPSLLNPFLGYLTDRFNAWLIVALTPAISATAIGLLGQTDHYAVLAVLLICAGASSMAFHLPVVRMMHEAAGNRVGLAMSIFMAGSELARALGPILLVWVVSIWGLEGTWRLIGLGLATSLLLFWRLRGERVSQLPRSVDPKIGQVWAALRGLFLPLSGVLFFHGLLFHTFSVFLASLVDEAGFSLQWAGAAQTSWSLAGFVGAFIGGALSDRVGRRITIAGSLVLAGLATFFLALVMNSGMLALILPGLLLSGMMTSLSNPVLLAVVVEHEPRYAATSTGIYMLLELLTRMTVTLVAGAVGDSQGLAASFALAGALSLCGVFFVGRLPGVS